MNNVNKKVRFWSLITWLLGIGIPIYIDDIPLTSSGDSRMGEGMFRVLLIVVIPAVLALIMSMYAFIQRQYITYNTKSIALTPLLVMLPMIYITIMNLR